MKCRTLALALLGLVSLQAAPPSAADLLRAPEVTRATLSPDGRYVLLVEGFETDVMLLHDLESGQRRRVPVRIEGLPDSRVAGIIGARWLNPERVLLTFNQGILRAAGSVAVSPGGASGPSRVILPPSGVGRSFSGYVAVDITGERQVELPTVALRGDTLPLGLSASFAWDARRFFVPHAENDAILAPAYEGSPNGKPYVARIDTSNGRVARIAANPGRVTDWIFERSGRGALGVDGARSTAKLMALQKDSDRWVEAADLGEPRSRLRFDIFDAARGLVYGSRAGADGHWSFAAFQLKNAQWTPPIVANPRYDVGPPEYRAAFAGVDLNDVIFSAKTGLPLAVGFVSDGPRQQWLDATLNQAMQAVVESAPGTTSFVIEVDRAETRALVLTWSPQDPGCYSVVDLATKKITRIAERMPWLRGAELGAMFPFTCRARDGTELDAYLTVPPGAKPSALPLVVVLRESLSAREAWGFYPLAQFLAGRGYAVLQVNHRGSSGYGGAFLHTGRNDPGGVVQDDIVDAVKAVVARGMADPQRVGIVGANFGGHSALLALAREPGLFQCGAAITPVTDWRELARENDSIGYRLWFETAGLFPNDRSTARLREASALHHAARIKAPLLLVHAELDARAPLRATKDFAQALKKAGREPETFYFRAARGPDYDKKQIEIFERLATFMGQHMPVARP